MKTKEEIRAEADNHPNYIHEGRVYVCLGYGVPQGLDEKLGLECKQLWGLGGNGYISNGWEGALTHKLYYIEKPLWDKVFGPKTPSLDEQYKHYLKQPISKVLPPLFVSYPSDCNNPILEAWNGIKYVPVMELGQEIEMEICGNEVAKITKSFVSVGKTKFSIDNLREMLKAAEELQNNQ